MTEFCSKVSKHLHWHWTTAGPCPFGSSKIIQIMVKGESIETRDLFSPWPFLDCARAMTNLIGTWTVSCQRDKGTGRPAAWWFEFLELQGRIQLRDLQPASSPQRQRPDLRALQFSSSEASLDLGFASLLPPLLCTPPFSPKPTPPGWRCRTHHLFFHFNINNSDLQFIHSICLWHHFATVDNGNQLRFVYTHVWHKHYATLGGSTHLPNEHK